MNKCLFITKKNMFYSDVLAFVTVRPIVETQICTYDGGGGFISKFDPYREIKYDCYYGSDKYMDIYIYIRSV